MKKFITRMQPIFDMIIHTGGIQGDSLRRALEHNNDLLLRHRQGEYLIKHYKTSEWIPDALYVSYQYTSKGGIPMSTRAKAQWFSKEEAKEFLENSRSKAFQMVRR